MKTTIKELSNFNPIEISFRIESIYELKQLLLMSSILASPHAYDKEYMLNSSVDLGESESESYTTPGELSHFIDSLLPSSQWQHLHSIHQLFVNKDQK